MYNLFECAAENYFGDPPRVDIICPQFMSIHVTDVSNVL